jgi:hypothetical protein
VIPSKSGGQPEKKDVLLEEHDPIWLELRHAHIADVSLMPRYLFLFGNGKKKVKLLDLCFSSG